MAITQRDVTKTGTTSDTTTLTISKPTGVASGDVLIAGITSNNTAQVAPSGWTEFEGQTAAGTAWQVRLYYKVAGGSEPASYSWTVGDLGPSAGIVQAWQGVDNTTPIDGTADSLDESGITDPNTGPSATMSSANGKLFYIRAVRRTSAGGDTGSVSTADSNASLHISIGGLSGTGNTAYEIGIFSANAQYTSSGVKSGLATSYTPDTADATNFEATFGLKQAGTPASGTLTSSTAAVTSSMSGEREPNSGAIASSTPTVSSSMSGTHHVPADGPIDSTVPAVSAALEGAVDPIGDIDATLPLVSVQISAETRQFGEHVIAVEPDHRAFLVVDDGTDVGLKEIKRSQVTDA